MRNFKWLLIAVETVWIILLAFGCVAMVDVIRSYADTPNMIVNGEYVICEINTQDSALDIQEAPPIGRVSEDLAKADEEINNRVYGSIHFTEEEGQLLRSIVALESHGEGLEGQKAVVEVIFNRILSSKWPNSVRDVIYQKGQFATVKYLSRPYVLPSEAEDDAISDVLRETSTVLPSTDYIYFSRGKSNGKGFIKINHHWFSR